MNNIKYFFIGCFAILCIYHLFIYKGRKKDILNLIFSIYCLIVINLLISSFFYHKNTGNIIFFNYFIFSMHLIPGIIILFTYFIFDLKNTKIARFTFFYYILITIYLLIIIMINYTFNNKFLINIYYLLIPILLFAFLYSIYQRYIKEKRYKDKKTTIIILGISTSILYCTIFLLLLTFKIIIINNPSIYTYIAFLIQGIFFAYALTDSFNKEHNDLVELKELLEQKVNERSKQLKEAHEQKTNTFINIAHETKTPLTLISNYMDKFIKKHREYYELAIIKNNIDKLKNDMINFLDIKKLEKGQIFYNHNQIINISNLLNEKIKLFKEAACNNRIKIIADNIKNNLYIKIDPYALDRVINNLLDNAVKYNIEDGTITISLIEKSNKIIFTVKDTGIGIPKEQQQNIFNPYHQITHEKRNIQGIGMGLNIVKNIINDINGKIEIDSEPDKGTTFKIIFDKHTIKKEDAITSNVLLSKPFGSTINIKLKEEIYDKYRKNILIIEDNIEMLSYLQDNFYDEYNVFTAKNGLKALNKINKIPKPNIIISDIMMDKMNGFEFYDKVMKNEEYNDIPFIFLTALTSNNDKIKGLSKGAVDYIYKPFTIEELQKKIKSLLRIQHNQKKNNLEIINDKMNKILYEKFGGNYNEFKYSKIYIKNNINKKEQDIIELLINGFKYKQIALKLNLPMNTIRKYVHIIYQKLNITNKIELIKKLKY